MDVTLYGGLPPMTDWWSDSVTEADGRISCCIDCLRMVQREQRSGNYVPRSHIEVIKSHQRHRLPCYINQCHGFIVVWVALFN